MSRLTCRVLSLLVLLLGSCDILVADEIMTDSSKHPIHALLILDHGHGANWDIQDERPSIREQLQAFGWDITTAALTDTVQRCEFSRNHGLPPIAVDSLLAEIRDVTAFDIVCLLPNTTGMEAVRQDSITLSLLRQAVDSGLVVAAWCKSVRVLAAAGLLQGLQVVGHADFKAEYEAAGATYLGNDHPPVTQGKIMTAVRSRFYRVEACQAMQAALMAARP